MMNGKVATEVIWRPQPGPQKALIDCSVPEIFYGGARGGGKTDGVLGKYGLKALRYGSGFNGIFFRRELPMLDDAIERSADLYKSLGADWNDQKKTWRFGNGARLRFRPLERTSDAEKYQGQNVSDACVEEAGNFPESTPVDRLNGILRSAAGVPTQLILTGNPGGPGHQWIKGRYIDPAPRGMQILRRKLANGYEHRYVFIPSRLENNRFLQQDQNYVTRLHMVGSPELVRAWLEGDWAAIAGAYFPEFSMAKHVIAPFTIPKDWHRFRAMDWGSARPFSVGWYAVADGVEHGLPRGALVRYREWYGASGPNVGLGLHAEEVADGIVHREATDPKVSDTSRSQGFADPSMFAEDGGPSIAERMARRGALWRKADNKRLPGWDQVRARLAGEDNKPMLYLFSTCVDLIRTLPALQHDDNKPEDVDTDGEDHAGDELRYACMSRPYARPLVIKTVPRFLHETTIDEAWAKSPGRQKRI